MIAPANYLDSRDAYLLHTAFAVDAIVENDLLPWADPYIAQLFQQHEMESAANVEQRRRIVRPRITPARSRGLLAVA